MWGDIMGCFKSLLELTGDYQSLIEEHLESLVYKE